MALLFLDSFDHYTTAQMTRKWQSLTFNGSILPGGGRNGTQSFHGFGAYYATQFLGPHTTWICGIAFTFTQLPITSGGSIFALRDGGTVQCKLYLNPDGTLAVARGHNNASVVPLAGSTSSNALSVGSFYYIEWKVPIGTSIAANSCKYRVNGIDWGTVNAGESTQSTINASATQFSLGNVSINSGAAYGQSNMDDLYVCDGTGAVNNDFLGDVMVNPYYAAGAGATTAWTPSAGSNYQNVGEHPPDDDATYNKSGTAAQVDLYALDQITGSAPTIMGVQWNAQMRKNDASSYVLNRAIRSGTTTFLGSGLLTPNTSYQNFREVIELNPNTGTAWTKTTFNALQAGQKLVSVV